MEERAFTISFSEEESDGRVYINVQYGGQGTVLQLTPTGYIAATPLWDASDTRAIPELNGTDFRGFIKILNTWAESVDSNRQLRSRIFR